MLSQPIDIAVVFATAAIIVALTFVAVGVLKAMIKKRDNNR
ncbi:MAG: hypothetical protein ACQESH_07505 [Campylobacterota bacterium]